MTPEKGLLAIIQATQEVVKVAIDDAEELRAVHDAGLGRTTLKNKRIGAMYDEQIAKASELQQDLAGLACRIALGHVLDTGGDQ